MVLSELDTTAKSKIEPGCQTQSISYQHQIGISTVLLLGTWDVVLKLNKLEMFFISCASLIFFNPSIFQNHMNYKLL